MHRCPHCHEVVSDAPEFAGEAVDCPHCGGQYRAPEAEVPEAANWPVFSGEGKGHSFPHRTRKRVKPRYSPVVVVTVCAVMLACSGLAAVFSLANRGSSDREFEVTRSETFLHYKRSLDVRLPRKVSETRLRAIAQELRARDSRTYDRTFICYYLPGMEIDRGAWATTHFIDGKLEVRINEFILKSNPATVEGGR